MQPNYMISRGFILAAFAVAMVFATPIRADDDVSRTFALEGFDRIDISGVYELHVAVGKQFSVTMSGPQKELDQVEASVENGVLVLSQDEEMSMNFFSRRRGVTATITMPDLKALDVSGVVDAEVVDIVAENFSVELSGVGEVDVAGKCIKFHARLSGVGDLDAEDLRCKSADVRVSGLGDASVYASVKANATVSGMGEINIYGSPSVVVQDGSMMSDITVH